MHRKTRAKGVSTILSAVIFTTIMLFSFALIYWNGQTYLNFVTAQNSRENAFVSRASEVMSVTGFKFEQNTLNLTITNYGPNPVRIVKLWVFNLSSPSGVWQRNFALSNYINPFKSVTNVGQTQGTFYATNLYTVKLVTDRGTIFGASNFRKTTLLGTAQGTGWLSIDWYSYKYTSTNNANPLPAWNFSKSSVGNAIQFQINVINHWDKNLTLLKYSYIRLDKSTTAGSVLTYYLMDPNSTPSSILCYNPSTNPVIIHPTTTGNPQTGGTPVTIKFLGAGYTAGQCNSAPALKVDKFSVYMVLYYQYTIGGQTYNLAQTIPFEGTNIIT